MSDEAARTTRAAGTAGTAEAAESPLERLRGEIEQVDAALVQLLRRRMELARAAGSLKQAAGTARLDPAREAAVVRHGCELARDAGLPVESVREILWRVVGLCREVQAPGRNA